jgi:hypothetical protein
MNMFTKAMLTDIKAKKNSSNARKTLDCLTGRLSNNKILNKMACKPKTRIIVKTMGLEDVIV